MKKFLEDVKEDKIIHYILIALAAIIAGIPLINLRIYGTDDGFIHILRIIGVDNILKIGEFPPLIYSKYIRGFGYAINLFYPPIVTYVPLFFRIFNIDYINCLKIYSFITILISGMTMYQLVKEITAKRPIALFAAIVYIFIPYRLETIYNRFAIGEFSAYMFLPLLFLGLYNLFKKDGMKHYYIAISAIGLILCHQITTEYAAIFSLIYVLLNIKQLKNKEIVKKLMINIIFILGITAFFTIPIIEHKIATDYGILSPKIMLSEGKNVANTTIDFKLLFTGVDENTNIEFSLGITLIILIIIGIFTYKKTDENYKQEYLLFVLIAIISLFMTTKFFPWGIMPSVLSTLQFAWRMLAFFEFAISIIAAINLYTFINIVSKDKNYLNNILTSITIIILMLTMSKINYNYKYDQQKAVDDKTYEENIINSKTISHASINREYLPCKALKLQKNYLINREDRIYILQGNAEIKEENKDGLNLNAQIKNIDKDTVLELPYIYYLGYKVSIEYNNQTKELKNFESDNGFVAVKISEDISDAKITVKYTGTIIEKNSYVISIIFLMGFIIYIIYLKNREENTKGEK